ncbi:MAG: SH3 domain-containing protein [Anaerolineae bacterium]|nr:SH3 domain-containing protein [Anaerolineae bacterium]MCB0230677.1 SH3 domain-containing protein [Anaerolineae bacterium]MCB0246935.1 SH3 domain-containing protein [Anaerolineae bacterium]MCB9130517.1 SH3 domain-containing protein [Anaerolineales bacterium]MCO5242235.1 SH3 domain-containing protein [Anaerolineae bacterium]
MSEPRRVSGEPSGVVPDALYEQGMAHYQRREWHLALDYFERLQDVDPNWPGLASLIDEVRWFIQLEQVHPDADPVLPERAAPSRRFKGKIRWLAPVLIGVMLTALLLWWQAGLPGLGGSLERDTLYNRGQASLSVGDYVAAREAFTQLAILSPGDPGAVEGLERATRLERLAEAYQAAQSAIADEAWDTAEERLRQVLAADPAYGDAADLLAQVQRERTASDLFAAGIAAYDSNDIPGAIGHLERLVEADPDYQHDAVRELLFVLYVRDAQALLATPDAGQDAIRKAIARYGKALSLRPRNVQAANDGQLANRFLSVRQALDRSDPDAAEAALAAIMQVDTEFAGGQAAEMYYQLLTARADEARSAGREAEAVAALQAALALPVADVSIAQAALQINQPTATPQATATPVVAPTPYVEVQSDTLNVRLGPGTDYPVLGQVVLGDRFTLVGRNEAGDWLVVCCVDEQAGWVTARLVSTAADVGLLPVGLAPTRVPTATALPTVAATPTVPATPTQVATELPTSTPQPPPPEPSTPEPPPPPPTATPPPR